MAGEDQNADAGALSEDKTVPDQGGADATVTQPGNTGGNDEAKASDKGAGTVFDDIDDTGADDGGTPKTPFEWRNDWREKFANGDDKALGILKRYSSPESFAKAAMELRRQRDSGQTKKVLADDATPEEIAAWRKENGLPDKLDDYKLSYSDGFVPSEDDTALIDEFRGKVFDRNINPAHASELVQWFLGKQDEVKAEQLEGDKAYKLETIEQARAEYGADYRSNIAANKALMESIYGDMANDIMNARLPDGTILGNNFEILKRQVDYALEALPEAKLMPSGTGDVAKGVDAEIDAIKKRMNTDYHGYMADKEMQSRYLQLLEARERRQSRAA